MAIVDKSRLLIVDDEPGNIRILSNILAEDYELSAVTRRPLFGKDDLSVSD